MPHDFENQSGAAPIKIGRLHSLDLSPEFKQKLFDAKKESIPDRTPVETAVLHLNHLKEIDSASLDAAEQHPNLAAAIIKSAFEKQR